MYKTKKEFRPNTKKIYEDFHGVKVPKGWAVHHTLPVRLGGTHDVSNLELLDRDCHVFAHLALYQEFGDIRDLCASYMLRGLSHEARKLAAAKGGRAGQAAARARGQVLGFGALSKERHAEIASAAGKIGGVKQRDLGLGFHSQTKEEHLLVAAMGGRAGVETNGLKDSARQAERGKLGGPKNKGFRWCNDGVNEFKYTAAQQAVECFQSHIDRTGLKSGKLPSKDKGGKFYNDGTNQWVFRQSKHLESFGSFLERTGMSEGRVNKPGSYNLGSAWYNNGVNSFKFMPSKHTESFEEFIASNHYNIGRIKK